METTLIYQPTNPAIKAIDLQITTWLDQLDHSLYDGPEYKIAIFELETGPFKPYRTIITGCLNGYITLDQKLDGLGLKNLIPESSAKGYDGLYVLK